MQSFARIVVVLFVVKEIRQKLGKTFEILGYVAIGLGLFAFIF